MIDELLKKQRKLSQSKRWKAALEVNDKLIELSPDSPTLFKERSRFFRRLNDLNRAEEAMSVFLQLRCGASLESLVNLIRDDLKKELSISDIYSSYKITSSGGMNYGVIEHTAEDGSEFFTKIVTSAVGDSECYFYNCVRPKFQSLQYFTLSLLHYYRTKKGKLAFLTFPKISGGHATLESNKETIFSIYRTIAGITKNDLKDFMVSDTDMAIITGAELKLSRVFSQLDDHDVMKKVFSWVMKKLQHLSVENRILLDFNHLEELLVDKKSFMQLQLKSEYRLMHGDFHQGNMLLNSKGDQIFLIDWPNMTLAPKGVDLTKMFRRERWSFRQIRNEFLDDEKKNGTMQEIDKCAFAFSMILTWLNFSPKKTLGKYDDYIGPAIKYIEATMSKI